MKYKYGENVTQTCMLSPGTYIEVW